MTNNADNEVQWVPYDQLLFDHENPRLAGIDPTPDQQDLILEWLWRNKAVNELIDSILTNGYWPHEELFATEEDDRLIVLEGNRRLAAVKIILDEGIRRRLRVDISVSLSSEKKATLELLPVVIKTREEVWSYVGFKHVNGPQAWDSIAKAQYIHRVHQAYGISLDEIAKTIGDRHDTVARLFRGYSVLKQAQLRTGFDPDDARQRKFPFSHLWTGIGYASIRAFLGLTRDRLELPDPVPEENLENLKEFMIWLYGSQQNDIEPRIKRQNPDLRNLAEVLGSPRGEKVLRAGLPLSAAHAASLGDERLFQDALTQAEAALRSAKGYVATGYNGETDVLETAKALSTQARSLYREMLEMCQPEDEI